jgi:hypothetical protein
MMTSTEGGQHQGGERISPPGWTIPSPSTTREGPGVKSPHPGASITGLALPASGPREVVALIA